MVNLAVAPRRRPAWPAEDTTPKKPLLKRYWDLLAVVLLMLGSFPVVWVSQQTVTPVPDLGLIDDNWHLDSTFKALRGIWIGRDVAFTHGPIFQVLSSIPARFMPTSFGALYATWNTVPLWCAVLFAYLALRLILPEQRQWKRFVLLLLLASFWETSLRSTFPVLLFALFLRGWYAVQEGRLRAAYAGAAGAALCAIAFLIAGDVGIYSTAAWLICWLAVAVELRRKRFLLKLLEGLLAFVAAAGTLVFLINLSTAGLRNFKFWRDAWAQVAAYRWATPAAMTDQGTNHLVGGLLICAAIFVARSRIGNRYTPALAQRTGFLLGGFVLGLVVLQSALVRSDIGHVMIGLFPLIFFAAAILFSFEGRATTAGVIIAVAASMLFSRPVFRPSSILRLASELGNPLTECLPGYSEFDRACFLEPFTPQMLTAGGNFLSRNTRGNDWIFVFPYQTMFGVASGRNVAGGLMQPYTASGPYLSQLEISGLAGKAIPAALYLTDPDYRHMSQAQVERWSHNYQSVPVDGIPNFTRVPEVWMWMVKHYRFAEQLYPGVVGLLRDDARASTIGFETQPLGLAPRTYAITERRSETDLGAPSWPAAYDFIRLRMTVHYSDWWRLRKPERLQLEIRRADGSRSVQWMILQPNVSGEVWFYPWDGPDLANYFKADVGQWRPAWRSPIVRLRLLATPLDWVSQQPDAISIESADAVRLVMAPQR